MTFDSTMRSAAPLLTVLVTLCTGRARAQDAGTPPSASVLRTSTTGAVDPGLAEAIDRLVRADLDAVHVVRITGSVALDLADVQLALGCAGETDACLGAAAREIGVDALVLPSVVRTGDETVVSIAYFRTGASPALRRVVARMRGADPATQALEAVDGLLRELFPEVEFPRRGGTGSGAGAGSGEGSGTGAGAGTGPSPGPSLSPWPIVVAGVGVVALGTGVAFGLASQGAADDYEGTNTTTPAGVDAALLHLADARSSATIANIFFVAGGIALAAGITWGAIELSSGSGRREQVAARIVPVVGPTMAGVIVGGAL